MESPPRVLFVVEGNTDIRFVTGLAGACNLSMLVSRRSYEESGLEGRVLESKAPVTTHKIPGGRLAYQVRSLRWLLQNAQKFDLLLSQELLRGTLSAAVAGRLRKVPVLAHVLIPPIEYYRCRRLRGQSWFASIAGQAAIRSLLRINGRLVTRTIALGGYLESIIRPYCPRVERGHYYGVDTTFFRPASSMERSEIRQRLGLPAKSFLALASSRVSHEKDPETALQAVARARAQGLDAVLLNLGGGYRDFLNLASKLGLPNQSEWVMARPAQHPMTELADFYRCADVVVQSSIEEGLGLSPLEGLASGTPVVASDIGGLACTLPGYGRLVPRRDVEAMAHELLWVGGHPGEARQQALTGRAFVEQNHSREIAFADWRRQFERSHLERP